jgi:caffeoyl-CoA O-methyltransferase
MARAKMGITPEIGDYLARHARQDEILARVEKETAARPDAQMQVSPDEGALLTLLAQLVGATRALEVGTFTGYSAICIARGLAAGGTLTCLELSPEFAATALANVEAAGLADRVEIKLGPADAALRALPEERPLTSRSSTPTRPATRRTTT